MKTDIVGWAILVALLALATPSSAQIVTGETMFEERHRSWRSFLLVLPDSVGTRAATTATSDGSTALVLDFQPTDCKWRMRFIVEAIVPTPTDGSADTYVSLRTDNGSRYEFVAPAFSTMGDLSIMVEMPGDASLVRAVKEMLSGRTLRVKMNIVGSPPGGWYSSYSLMGMTAAFIRGARMCSDPAKYISWR